MKEFDTALRFLAMSDIHFSREYPSRQQHFERGLALAYEYAETQEYKKIDVVTLNGDFTDHGEEEQFADMKECLDRCVRPETKRIPRLWFD